MMPPLPEPSPDLLYSADEMIEYGKACRALARPELAKPDIDWERKYIAQVALHNETLDLVMELEKQLNEVAAYDQQALELCEVCGWKAIIPGEPCLVCERNARMLKHVEAIPPGYQLVETDLLKMASESLGSFVSDHGWSQQDMDVMDSIDAVIAAPKGVNSTHTPIYDRVAGEMFDKPTSSNCSRHPSAPHGVDIEASFRAGHKVCQCASWTPGEAS